MKKVVNVSLHRSATQSFNDYCASLGYRNQHWPGFDFDKACEPYLERLNFSQVWKLYSKIAAEFDSFCDIPQSFIYKEFMRNYPDAVYLLLLRPVDKWIESVRRHTNGRDMDVMEKMQYWSILDVRKAHLSEYSNDELEKGYRVHLSNLVSSANRYKVKLEILNIDDKLFLDKLAMIFDVSKDIPFNDVDVNRKFYNIEKSEESL